MFLIPVIPSAAIYLTSGVLLVPLGRKAFGDEAQTEAWSFWAASALACALSYVLKLIAHVLQQKAIGEGFSGRVGVRALVGPNSEQMRATRFILSQPGMTVAKCALLCGGPDWPTSVICGLLHLDVFDMLRGLLPVILFTTPGTMLGALLTEAKYLEINLDAVCVLVIIVANVASLLLISSSMKRVVAEEGATLAAYPVDEEVAELDEQKALFESVLAEVGDFDDAPKWLQRLLAVGVAVSLVSTWAVLGAAGMLFQEFNITDDLSTLGNDGATYAIWFLGLKPWGLAALLLMGLGMYALRRFQGWGKMNTEKALAAGATARHSMATLARVGKKRHVASVFKAVSRLSKLAHDNDDDDEGDDDEGEVSVLEVHVDVAAKKQAKKASDQDMLLGELRAMSAKLEAVQRLENKIDALQEKIEAMPGAMDNKGPGIGRPAVPRPSPGGPSMDIQARAATHMARVRASTHDQQQAADAGTDTSGEKVETEVEAARRVDEAVEALGVAQAENAAMRDGIATTQVRLEALLHSRSRIDASSACATPSACTASSVAASPRSRIAKSALAEAGRA